MGGASFECRDCEMGFVSRYAYGRHMRNTHPVTPMVLNRREFPGPLPPNATYVGRGTAFGNRFHIGPDGSRDEVIDKYIAEKSQDEEFLTLVRRQLKGRHLVCHCAPERCHADWLRCIANED